MIPTHNMTGHTAYQGIKEAPPLKLPVLINWQL